MRYDISMTVEYAYDFASDHARNLLHLIPRSLAGRQTVIASLLTIDPLPHERRDAPDFFGNMATWIAYHDPIEAISLTLKAQARRDATIPTLDLSARFSDMDGEIAACQDLGPDAPHHYLGPSPRVRPDAAMADFATRLIAQDATTSSVVLSIGAALHSEMTFDPRATDAQTPPAAAFAQRRGVCQDFSHVMIACLRSLGIPSGYVSGFLRTTPPPGKPRLEGSDAMHAWVRAWCGREAGWIEFDPTNDTLAGQDHVVVAYGRDYSDVSPVRGTLRSCGGHTTQHFVDVVALPAGDRGRPGPP